MRIDRLDLLAFGPFTGQSLDLSRGREGLHLIFGLNEAGKSSALRAIQQLFRGIPPRSTDDFLHKHSEMRLGAALRDASGAILEIVRRKGQKNTLLGGDGKPLDDPDATLSRWLGGIAVEEFLQKFVIDHEALVEGGKTVIEGQGDLGRVLFAAGSGLAGLGAVQKGLDEEAETLFKPNGSKPQINARLAELKATRDRLKAETLRSSDYRAHDDALQAAVARKQTLDQDCADVARQRDHLSRLAEALEPIAHRAALLDELAELADVPRLSADFTYRRTQAESLLAPNERFAAEADDRIRGLTRSLAGLNVPTALLAQAEAIQRLHLRLGSHARGETERIRLDAERARFEAEARALLRDLGRDEALDFDAIEPLRLKTADRAAILELANQRQALLQARDDAANALRDHGAKSQALAARLAALGPPRETEALRLAVKRAQKLGDLEAPRRAEHDALQRDRRRLDAGSKALGHWSGPVAALEAVPIPSEETIDRFQQEFDAIASERESLRRQRDERDVEAQAKRDEIERLGLDGAVPTEDALAAARLDRDTRWQRLKQTWDDRQVPPYEEAIHQADEAADRLRREAKRVGDHARLRLDLARLAELAVALETRQDAAELRLAVVETRWNALWQPLGITAPGSPREMRAWTRKADDLVTLAVKVREQTESIARLDAQIERHRREIIAALTPLEMPADDAVEPSSLSLADLIDRAQDRIEALAKEAKTRERLRDDLDARKADLPGREAAAAIAQTAWDHWQAGWSDAMTRIGRDPTTLPVVVNVVLDQTAALFDRIDKARTRAEQIETIDREATAFKIDAWKLADRVAPDLAPGQNFDPALAVAALADRLAQAERARQHHDELTARLAEQTEGRDAARVEIAQARASLAVLRREARCESDDALPAIEQQAARRQALETERSRLNTTLVTLAGGTSLGAFLAEAEEVDASSLGQQIRRLDERLAELGQEREVVNQTIGAERQWLRSKSTSPGVADLGQDDEDLRARIRSDVEQYARLRLASAILRAGIERYRNRSQGPVLDRASALFSTLTLGSFDRLTVDYDDGDNPVLKGVRPGRREPLGVNAMSLGTADQLYLALRLAILETSLSRREPLPLIVDDILIQFDNPRSAATLSVLAELSAQTQVLIFTHHEHLLDLAANAVPGERLFVHRLSGQVAMSS